MALKKQESQDPKRKKRKRRDGHDCHHVTYNLFSLFFFFFSSLRHRRVLVLIFLSFTIGEDLSTVWKNKNTTNTPKFFFFLHTPGEHTVSAVVRSSFFCFVSKVGARERRRKVCRTVFHAALPKSLSSHFWVPCPFLAGGNWRGAVFEKKIFFSLRAHRRQAHTHTHCCDVLVNTHMAGSDR